MGRTLAAMTNDKINSTTAARNAQARRTAVNVVKMMAVDHARRFMIHPPLQRLGTVPDRVPWQSFQGHPQPDRPRIQLSRSVCAGPVCEHRRQILERQNAVCSSDRVRVALPAPTVGGAVAIY